MSTRKQPPTTNVKDTAIGRPEKTLRSIPIIRAFYKVYLSIKNLGFKATLRRIKNRFFGRFKMPQNSFVVSQKDRAYQQGYKFSWEPKISILVPLFNTPAPYLKQMIESVQAQTYQNWELCLEDASDASSSQVHSICQNYAQSDSRIVYEKLASNAGISNNTNQAIHMAIGDYFALVDHDDILHATALFEVLKAINEQNADFIYTDEGSFHKTPNSIFHSHFKPDYSPDTLRSYNYISHLTVFSSELQKRVGQFRSDFDGSQDYDMILRLSEEAKTIVHIPKILYYWRAHSDSVASGVEAKSYAVDAAKHALREHLKRVGLDATVKDNIVPTTYKMEYAIPNSALVSIIIPNKDHVQDLDKCLTSIAAKTNYPNYQVLIVENNSQDPQTFEYYNALSCQPNVKVLTYQGGFNFSAINNWAVEQANSEYLLFLNNDIEIITPNWIEEMLMFAQRPDVGAVGAKLFYPDGTIQHAGVILGIGGVAGHAHKNFFKEDFGYVNRLQVAQNLTAVTAACLLMRKQVFKEIGGFDEEFKIAFNDVDLCMKIRAAGYLIVFTPFAELYHYESKSRGLEETPEQQERFAKEARLFMSKWPTELEKGDPYYNPNLTLEREDFSLA